MQLTEREFYAHELRYGSMIQEAEQRRMRHLALGRHSELPKPCCYALYWLGCRLVKAGSRLQAKYGDSPNSPVAHAT